MKSAGLEPYCSRNLIFRILAKIGLLYYSVNTRPCFYYRVAVPKLDEGVFVFWEELCEIQSTSNLMRSGIY